jgi:hypothetical protein
VLEAEGEEVVLTMVDLLSPTTSTQEDEWPD